jgi:hypothetical protein
LCRSNHNHPFKLLSDGQKVQHESFRRMFSIIVALIQLGQPRGIRMLFLGALKFALLTLFCLVIACFGLWNLNNIDALGRTFVYVLAHLIPLLIILRIFRVL